MASEKDLFYLPTDDEHVEILQLKLCDYIFRIERKISKLKYNYTKANKIIPENFDEFTDIQLAYLVFARKFLELLISQESLSDLDIQNYFNDLRHCDENRRESLLLIASEAYDSIKEFVFSKERVLDSIPEGRVKSVQAMFAKSRKT